MPQEGTSDPAQDAAQRLGEEGARGDGASLGPAVGQACRDHGDTHPAEAIWQFDGP